MCSLCSLPALPVFLVGGGRRSDHETGPMGYSRHRCVRRTAQVRMSPQSLVIFILWTGRCALSCSRAVWQMVSLPWGSTTLEILLTLVNLTSHELQRRELSATCPSLPSGRRLCHPGIRFDHSRVCPWAGKGWQGILSLFFLDVELVVSACFPAVLLFFAPAIPFLLSCMFFFLLALRVDPSLGSGLPKLASNHPLSSLFWWATKVTFSAVSLHLIPGV